jgi:hypothetical protein
MLKAIPEKLGIQLGLSLNLVPTNLETEYLINYIALIANLSYKLYNKTVKRLISY